MSASRLQLLTGLCVAVFGVMAVTTPFRQVESTPPTPAEVGAVATEGIEPPHPATDVPSPAIASVLRQRGSSEHVDVAELQRSLPPAIVRVLLDADATLLMPVEGSGTAGP